MGKFKGVVYDIDYLGRLGDVQVLISSSPHRGALFTSDSRLLIPLAAALVARRIVEIEYEGDDRKRILAVAITPHTIPTPEGKISAEIETDTAGLPTRAKIHFG
ncbi:hypothetical protein [Sinorhizobium meliloti]|uniref:hypothetical protein n=1 Tax=Rhizobium meliloti TaxID=382 RepID=UPI000FDA6BFA|nr:hypothetical protein [Sinorhizobium meliloti]RVE91081.1 hypothetical protein CN238_08425 [Sinorhizobium meliloti]RVH34148.1 hypothetical protein CN214_07385 [Sinorhizobium meliloti]